MMNYYGVIFFHLVTSPDLSIGLEYFIEPKYLNIGDSLQHFCEFEESGTLVISKGSTPCIYNCEKINDGCQLYRSDVSIDCNNDHIQINIPQAQESDFGEWKCSVTETISILVQEYGKNLDFSNTQRVLGIDLTYLWY